MTTLEMLGYDLAKAITTSELHWKDTAVDQCHQLFLAEYHCVSQSDKTYPPIDFGYFSHRRWAR